jgi:hypothetical protein
MKCLPSLRGLAPSFDTFGEHAHRVVRMQTFVMLDFDGLVDLAHTHPVERTSGLFQGSLGDVGHLDTKSIFRHDAFLVMNSWDTLDADA